MVFPMVTNQAARRRWRARDCCRAVFIAHLLSLDSITSCVDLLREVRMA